tara:strand:+ start:695 stop:1603 length:909 start_codon:yes stop_codon:yes gene_type:complete
MFFYLEWLDKRPNKIELLKDEPQEINFQIPFKIKKDKYILCGNINPDFRTYYPPPKLEYTKNQYLLSHLQKSVRRMDDIKSVQTAKHLIDLDCTSFLRRLPIIMLEDVTIHESIVVIVWLMIADSKKYPLKIEMMKWLLGVVYYLSNETLKTHYLKEEDEYEWDERNTTDEVNILLKTLRFRKAYGGMKGDMQMIEYYLGLILRNDIHIQTSKIPLVKPFMSNLSKKDWIYEANDFHCNRYIIDRIQQYYPRYKKEYLKTLIWKFSSSLNKRESVVNDTKQEEDWDIIKGGVKKIQKSCKYY